MRTSLISWTSVRATAWTVALVVLVSGVNAHARPEPAGPERAAARRAAIAAARAQVQAAQSRVQVATERVRATWEADSNLSAAEAALQTARADLERASLPVFKRLREDDAAYRAVLQEEVDARTRLADEQARLVAADPASTQPAATRPSGTEPPDGFAPAEDESLNVPVPSDEQVNAAVDKLGHRTRRREIEARAIAADPAAAEAQQRVDAATAELKALQTQFESVLLNDPEYRAARDQLVAARAELSRAAAANY
jgi:hypothetical protein